MRHRLRVFFAFAVIAGVVAAIGAPTASATTPLDAYKTATGHWERTFKWTIEKSVTPDSWTLRTGESGTSTYTIVVTKDAGTDAVWVDGEVCVTNNGGVATENLHIAERVRALFGDGSDQIIIVDTIDVSANPVLDPGESHCYPYKFTITPVAGAIGYTNRARVTITNDPREPGTPLGPSVDAPFNIPSSPTLINDSINVDDTNGGSWPFSASGSVSYDRTFTCDGDGGEHNNTATIRETGQSDDAKVTVRCTPPPQGCSYTLGYWKNHSKYGPAKIDPTWALIGEDTAFFLSGQSWYQVLNSSSSGGNAYYILAKQYIAARLNILSGAGSTAAVDAALTWATTFFQTYTPSSNLSKTVRGQAVAAADLLDNYNNGVIGPGHCSNS